MPEPRPAGKPAGKNAGLAREQRVRRKAVGRLGGSSNVHSNFGPNTVVEALWQFCCASRGGIFSRQACSTAGTNSEASNNNNKITSLAALEAKTRARVVAGRAVVARAKVRCNLYSPARWGVADARPEAVMGDERHCIARLGSSADARPLGIILSKRNDSFLIHHRARLWADGTTRCSAGRRTGWARCVVAMTISSRQKGQDKEDAERGGKWARWLYSRKAASPGRAAAKFALRANICTCAFCAIPQTCKIRTSGFDI